MTRLMILGHSIGVYRARSSCRRTRKGNANSEPNRGVLTAEEGLTWIAGSYFSADQSRTSVFITLRSIHTG